MCAGCGSLATTEMAQALLEDGQFDDRAVRPAFDASGRLWADRRHQSPMSMTDHIEAATGQRLGDVSLFETGRPRRELASPQRQARYGDLDDPDDGGQDITAPRGLAASLGLVSADPARERERARDRANLQYAAALHRQGGRMHPDMAESTRERQARMHRPAVPVQVRAPDDGLHGAQPQYTAGDLL